MALTIKVKLSNLPKLAITLFLMGRFDLCLDKRTLTTISYFDILVWPSYDLDFQCQIIVMPPFEE